MTRRRALAVSLACLAAGVAACSSVLGLDAPTLDSCLNQPCPDGSIPTVDAGDASDASSPDVEAEADAPGACTVDAQYDGPVGSIRCGGGCSPVIYCSGSTPVCCESTLGPGAPTFQCTSSESACSGYAIDCVNENDCSGTEVCCHYMAHAVCAGSCTSNADIACVPGSADDCPAGKSCNVQVVDDAGVATPYYLCQP